MSKKRQSMEFIEIRFSPRWNYVSATRGFLQNFMASCIGDQPKADKIAMAASELLENAIKYSSQDEICMNVSLDHKQQKTTVRVDNKAEPEAIATLKEFFKSIQQGEPMEAYLAQMKQTSETAAVKSRLGLARVRYEANAALELEIKGKQVSVSATI